ncbi:chromosomal replication initiator protein DnaA [Rhodospirillum centenum]|uniref:Chromosomal replication initiator protein DnaA n=1 Tax=Rhodospirillum centenum (strain ATCC 51521 / SW) TaxID=414684 RepID=B6IVU9_RHOCS|nr:chromosomal replication initiator protein DnaA [Rhodospirillum centenum]ACJ00423.1 chromosomal replication initiator protein DnaA [Rhodospirillum centenum SW]
MSVQQGSLDQQWAKVRGRLKDEVGETAYRSWLKPLTVGDFDGGQVRIMVPTRFMRDWIRTHYADRIRALWSGENPGVQSVEIVVATSQKSETRASEPPASEIRASEIRAPETRAPASGPAPARSRARAVAEPALDGAAAAVAPSAPAYAEAEPAPVAAVGGAEEREDLSAPLDPRFTFENFVVGKPNELAFAAARRVADASAVTFNPLFLYGGVGLGKTHLMHAIAWHIRRKDPSRRVIYLSAEKFMYQFIRALRFKDTMAFKEQFRSVDVLMIDDVQFISGKDSTQEEFFHTFNALVDQNRQVIISADKSPSDLEGMEERLRSRLGWGLVADIHPTTYELRLGILQQKADQMGAKIPQKVLEFLAHKITSNVRELEGALNRIVAHAELVGRAITLESTQEVLHDLLRASNRRVTIEEIQKKVAEHFNIRLSDMSSARRARAVARPRQVAMYLAKQLTQRSLPEIGRKFGDRDHTTVMHAVRKVEELCGTDPAFAEDVELLRRMLEG